MPVAKPVARERTRDPERTRARILRAARTEFMRHGYSGARIERISRSGRSSDRMIYYYFESKEKLYLAVQEPSPDGRPWMGTGWSVTPLRESWTFAGG